MADQDISLLNEIDFDRLENVERSIVFEKPHQLKFEGSTPICTIDFDGGKLKVYANFFRITPASFFLRSSYYKKIEGKVRYTSLVKGPATSKGIKRRVSRILFVLVWSGKEIVGQKWRDYILLLRLVLIPVVL